MTNKWYSVSGYGGIPNGYNATPINFDDYFCHCCGATVVQRPSLSRMTRNAKGIKVAAGKVGTDGWVSTDGKKQIHVVETKNGPLTISLRVGF